MCMQGGGRVGGCSSVCVFAQVCVRTILNGNDGGNI